ncbi:MAG TPA: LLM class flavin-dependent oxidoreductase [Micromonosporaceae bacterium]
MRFGVGLPTTVAGVTGRDVVAWAIRSEQAGLSSLGVLDRLVYANQEPITTLAAVAAVTQRIELMTSILLAAYRDSANVLAKQLATVDDIAGGRLVVGVAGGGRPDDFEAAGADFHHRGARLDAMLRQIRLTWAGTTGIGPGPVSPPPVLVGGHSPAAMRRAARIGQGWIMGGTSAVPLAELVGELHRQWRLAGREEPPRLVALTYFALGQDGHEAAQRHIHAYYGANGYADRVAASVLTEEVEVRAAARRYAEVGFDTLLFFPCRPGLDQVDRLADALTRASFDQTSVSVAPSGQ